VKKHAVGAFGGLGCSKDGSDGGGETVLGALCLVTGGDFVEEVGNGKVDNLHGWGWNEAFEEEKLEARFLPDEGGSIGLLRNTADTTKHVIGQPIEVGALGVSLASRNNLQEHLIEGDNKLRTSGGGHGGGGGTFGDEGGTDSDVGLGQTRGAPGGEGLASLGWFAFLEFGCSMSNDIRGTANVRVLRWEIAVLVITVVVIIIVDVVNVVVIIGGGAVVGTGFVIISSGGGARVGAGVVNEEGVGVVGVGKVAT
jgi:hypothetical protein